MTSNSKTMKVNATIEETIRNKVLAENEEREPSGRLAAGKLGWPLQWQMLWHFKVPTAPLDEYTLRKFQRGKDVEDRIVAWMEPEKTQVPVTYREVVGFADMVLDYPIEVKSVTNMAFKHIQREGPKYGHRLQGELYAKGLGFDKFGVAYVASDDYRVLCFEEEVTDETDKVIDAYEAQVKLGTVPVFEEKEPWHAIKKYSIYPDWMKLSEEEIAEKLAAGDYQIKQTVIKL